LTIIIVDNTASGDSPSNIEGRLTTMMIVGFGALLLTIVQLAQCKRHNLHEKLEREPCGQLDSWNDSRSHAGITLPLSAPHNSHCHRDKSTIRSAIAVDPTPCTSPEDVSVQGAHAALPRAEHWKSKNRGILFPVPSFSGETDTIVNETSMAAPSVLGTSPTASLAPQTNIPGDLGSVKKGLAYNSASLTTLFAGKGISWAYNWAAAPDGTIVTGAEYVAMLWGQKVIDSWSASVATAIADLSTSQQPQHKPTLRT
jgi:hypothetical protein